MMCRPTYIEYWCKKCHLPFTKTHGDAIYYPQMTNHDRCPYCGSTKLSHSLLGSFVGNSKKEKNKDGKFN